MNKIYEVRYKANDVIVAHQHASEHFAKLDAKQISKSHGRSLLGEVDYEKNNLIRVCEYAGGFQGKWENRSDAVKPCKILLTVEETTPDPVTLEAQSKAIISDDEKAEKKAALAAIREAAAKKNIKPEKAPRLDPKEHRLEKLLAAGVEAPLADLICASNVHADSPNYKALTLLWQGRVTDADFPGMKPKDVNALMNKLRSLLVANETGKAIVSSGGSAGMSYRLIDYKLEIIDEVEAS